MMRLAFLFLCFAACSPTPVTTGETFGDVHRGSFHLGPVDWGESQWTNSCGPYPGAVQALEGEFLAGVSNDFNGRGQLCDACALVTTGLGKTLVVRIITTGESKAPGDMDLSPAAFNALNGDDPAATSANPRPMTWQLAKCPAGSTARVQYQTGANEYWTSLWVRNARLPVEKVRVKSTNHTDFFSMRKENDGTWNDDSGFGAGSFTLELTGPGGVTTTQTFPRFEPGSLVELDRQLE